MAGQSSIIGKHHFISHGAIMPDMTVGEEASAVTDLRFSFTGGAAIHGYEFAKRIIVSDLEVGRFAAVFQILRLLTNRAIGVEFIPVTCAHRSAKSHVMLQPAVRA